MDNSVVEKFQEAIIEAANQLDKLHLKEDEYFLLGVADSILNKVDANLADHPFYGKFYKKGLGINQEPSPVTLEIPRLSPTEVQQGWSVAKRGGMYVKVFDLSRKIYG